MKTGPDPNSREALQEIVDAFKFLNGGRGVVVTPSIAARLREYGVEGPYIVQGPLPEAPK
jgi:hypothetical protein